MSTQTVKGCMSDGVDDHTNIQKRSVLEAYLLINSS